MIWHLYALWIDHHNKSAATAAKSLRSCPTLCDPMDGSPPGSSVPGILQARTLEWAAIPFSSLVTIIKLPQYYWLYSLHVHYIPVTLLLYNWKFALFSPFYLFLPLSSKLLVCIYGSCFCFVCSFVLFFFFIYSTYKWNDKTFVWLISLNIIPYRSIHVVTGGKILFFFMAE